MPDRDQTLFRKKTIDRISSPEHLTDYLRVTNPGIWVVLAAVIALLAGLFAWASVGTLETTAEAKVIVEDHTARIVVTDGSEIADGMPVRISSQKLVVATTEQDEYGRTVGVAEVALPDGNYDGTVVTETIRPIDFLLHSR